MGLFDILFGDDDKKKLEKENQLLRKMLTEKNSNSGTKKTKKVLYQCRYCGTKFIRNASEGAPLVGANCPKHPKGWCKGLHSWQRNFL